MQLREAEGQHAGTHEPEDEQPPCTEPVGEIPGGDLHQRVHELGRGGQRACLGKAELRVMPDQRQEKRDAARDHGLHALRDKHQCDLETARAAWRYGVGRAFAAGYVRHESPV